MPKTLKKSSKKVATKKNVRTVRPVSQSMPRSTNGTKPSGGDEQTRKLPALYTPSSDRKQLISEIQQKVVIFIVTIRGLSFDRTVKDKSILNTDANKSRLRVTKKLLDIPEQKMITARIDPAIRAYLHRVTLPSMFKEGMYALPIAMIDEVDKKMLEFQAERNAAVKALRAAFGSAKEEAKRELRSQYKESDYDIDLENAYRLEWQYVSLNAPDSLAQKDGKLFARENERIQRQWDNAINDMSDALRVGLSEIVNDLVQRLDQSEKRVKPSKLLARFEEFLSTFNARNVTNDAELAALADKARKLLKGVTTDTLIASRDIRQSVAQNFKSVQKSLTKLELESKKRRQYYDD